MLLLIMFYTKSLVKKSYSNFQGKQNGAADRNEASYWGDNTECKCNELQHQLMTDLYSCT